MHEHNSIPSTPHTSDRCDCSTYEEIGMYFAHREKWIEASECYRLAYTEAKTPHTAYNLGVCLVRSDRTLDAIPFFQEAIKRDPCYFVAYNNLGVAYARSGYQKHAKRLFKSFIRAIDSLENPDGHSDVYFHKSAAYYNLGRQKAAARIFQVAKKKSPARAGMYEELSKAIGEHTSFEPAHQKQQHSSPIKIGSLSFLWAHLQTTGRMPELHERALQIMDRLKQGIKKYPGYVGMGFLTASTLSTIGSFIPESAAYKNWIHSNTMVQLPNLQEDSKSSQQRTPNASNRASNRGLNSAPSSPPPPSSSAGSTPEEDTPKRVQPKTPKRVQPKTPKRVQPAAPSTKNQSDEPSTDRENTETPSPPTATSLNGSILRNTSYQSFGGNRSQRSPNYYNIGIGGVGIDLSTFLRFTLSDNITSSSSNRRADLITSVGINGATQYNLTRFNTLKLNLGVTYDKYLDNDEFDSHNNFLTLSTNAGEQTEFSFQMKVGNVLLDVYDQVSFSTSPIDARATTGGGFDQDVDEFLRLVNRAGIGATWQGKQTNISIGAERADTFPFDDQFDFTRNVQYNFPLGLGYQFAKNKKAGLNASYTIKDNKKQSNQFSNNDTQRLSIQPFLSWQPTGRLDLKLGLGYSKAFSDDDGLNNPDTSEDDAVNARFSIQHNPNRRFYHSLTFSRDLNFGLTTNSITTNRIDYNFSWGFMRRTDLQGGLGWEHGNESGPFGEKFDRYTGFLGMGYQINRNLSMNWRYSHSNKSSDQDDRTFHTNRVQLGLNYDF